MNEIIVFERSLDGFDFVKAKSQKIKPIECSVLIFIDINMLILDGWGFLERFDSFEEHEKEIFRIMVMSSSHDPKDIKKAYKDKNVSGYIAKPLSVHFKG